MEHFKDKVAIVTGGASGIGRGLCQELGQRGAVVTVADINAEGAQQVASGVVTAGGRARAMRLDVSQAKAVQQLVDETVMEYGQLDYMFNNAGVYIWGEVRDTSLEQWRHILDVNLWGVIHGTISAYQVMVKQGFGHIVNTAGGAGLTPVPLSTAYATTKHAVVGLSTSLRIEGAGRGVKVSVVSPGFVRTGLFDAATVVTKIKGTDALPDMSFFRMIDASDCARIILRGVERNKAIIMVMAIERFFWWMYRLCPPLVVLIFRKVVNDSRKLYSKPG